MKARASALSLPLRRLGVRLLRAVLLRYVRARPRPGDVAGAERRVCIVLNTAWGMGGTIRTSLNLAAHLAPRYDVQIISIGRTRDEPFFAFPDGVQVFALEDRRAGAGVGRGRGWLRRALERRSSVLLHHEERVAESFSAWTDVMLMRSLRRRTGVLTTTRPGFNMLAVDLALPGVITIGQEHMNFRRHRPPLRRAMLRRYGRLDALVVLTEADRRWYREKLEQATRVERIPNAVRSGMGVALADLDSRVIVAAGRLAAQKGYDLLIPAFAAVAAEHPDWRLRIFGGGPVRAQLDALIDAHDLSRAVTIERPAHDLPAVMERASIYVLSSRFEGLPLTLLEAMSKGMAVVSFDCPTGPGEVVANRRNGILVPPEDPRALSDGLRAMIEDRELRARCAAAAVETARDYTMQRVGAQWEALLEELWEERRAGASEGSPAHKP